MSPAPHLKTCHAEALLLREASPGMSQQKRALQALHHKPRALLVRANHAAFQSETSREILRAKEALQDDIGRMASPSTTSMVKVYRSFNPNYRCPPFPKRLKSGSSKRRNLITSGVPATIPGRSRSRSPWQRSWRCSTPPSPTSLCHTSPEASQPPLTRALGY